MHIHDLNEFSAPNDTSEKARDTVIECGNFIATGLGTGHALPTGCTRMPAYRLPSLKIQLNSVCGHKEVRNVLFRGDLSLVR